LQKRLISVDDFSLFTLPANPLLSPERDRVIYEVTQTDPKEDEYDVQLWSVALDGQHRRKLTSSGSKNGSAIWQPGADAVAFISNRAYGSQAWLLPMDGGEARQLTRFVHGISDLAWTSDGSHLVALVPCGADADVAVFASDVSAKDAEKQTKDAAEEWTKGPKRYDWLYYKSDGAGLSKGLYRQLVAIDVASGEFIQLTRGDRSVGAYAVSPDGATITFTSNRRKNADVDWWCSDLYQVPVSGGDATLLCDALIAQTLAYSPDGRRLAVAGHGEEYEKYRSAAHTHLFLLPASGGTPTCVTRAFPDPLGDTTLTDMRAALRTQAPVWSPDGRFLFALSSREGRSEIVRFDVSNAEAACDAIVLIGGDRDIYGFDTDGQGLFAATYATQTHPGRLVTLHATGLEPAPEGARTRRPRALTEPMTEQVVPHFPEGEQRVDACSVAAEEQLLLSAPQPYWFTSALGWRVQGWVIRPPQAKPGDVHPVILEIHGGPQLNYGHAVFHEMQWLAAQGYAVVLTNPRGGTSYGQDFVNAVRHDYGGNDAEDVMAGLDAAVAQFPFLDATQVAVTGGSYGGFMTNWLVGHTDRFFAAVSQRSISNWISFYGVSDIGPSFVESQHGLTVMDDLEALWKISPLAYAAQVQTPLLLVHSENDLRCPIEQAEQLYTVLRRLERDVSLLRIPNASHGLSRNGKPTLRVERLKAIFDWIDGHRAART